MPNIKIADPSVAEQRKKVQEKITALEATLPDKFPPPGHINWQVPGAAEFVSTNGATAEFLRDGTFQIGGAKPEPRTRVDDDAKPLVAGERCIPARGLIAVEVA